MGYLFTLLWPFLCSIASTEDKTRFRALIGMLLCLSGGERRQGSNFASDWSGKGHVVPPAMAGAARCDHRYIRSPRFIELHEFLWVILPSSCLHWDTAPFLWNGPNHVAQLQPRGNSAFVFYNLGSQVVMSLFRHVCMLIRKECDQCLYSIYELVSAHTILV